MGVLMCLSWKNRVVQEPGDMWESPLADETAQPGRSQFRVGSVEVFNVHYHLTTDWDWTNGEEKDSEISGSVAGGHISSPCLCSSYLQLESQDHSATLVPQWSPYIEPHPCPALAQCWRRTRQRGVQLLLQILLPSHLLKERSWLEDSLSLRNRSHCHDNCPPLWRWRKRALVLKHRLEEEWRGEEGEGEWWHCAC